MQKKHLFKGIEKINKVLWPIYIYLSYLLVSYLFSDLVYIDIFGFLYTVLLFGLPILITVWILLLFRKTYKEKTLFLSFLYCLLPGIIFGLHISYGLYAVGHGDDIVAALPQFGIVALISGGITGSLGLLVNFFINLIKRT